jgi:hypothetical protein
VERVYEPFLLVDRYADSADGVRVEAPARVQLLEASLEVLGVLAETGLYVGEVEGFLRGWLRVF